MGNPHKCKVFATIPGSSIFGLAMADAEAGEMVEVAIACTGSMYNSDSSSGVGIMTHSELVEANEFELEQTEETPLKPPSKVNSIKITSIESIRKKLRRKK